MKQPTKPTLNELNYARNLARKLGVEHRYRWDQDYWTREEFLTLIYGLEKRVRCG